LNKLVRLEKEEYIFTLESDNDTTLAERKAESFVKQNKFKKLAEDLRKKMAVRKMDNKNISPSKSQGNVYYI